MALDGNRGIRWEGTVTPGTIVALLGIAAPLIVGGITALNRIGAMSEKVTAINQTVFEQGNRFDSRLKNVEEGQNNLRLDLAKQDGMRSMVIDHESRIRALEARGK